MTDSDSIIRVCWSTINIFHDAVGAIMRTSSDIRLVGKSIAARMRWPVRGGQAGLVLMDVVMPGMSGR